MMERLFDEVLDDGNSGRVPRQGLLDFATALQKGCEASDDEGEREAMLAFVDELKGIIGQRPQVVTRQEWQARGTPKFNSSQGKDLSPVIIEIVTTILDTEEAVDGLRETMRGG